MSKKFYFCIKYTGLKIPHVIETEKFKIFPKDYQRELEELKNNENIPFNWFKIGWNHKSQFYV